MATCADIDNSLASLKASNDAKLAAMQAQIDACCAKADSAKSIAENVAAYLASVAAIVAGLVTSVASLVRNVAGLAVAVASLNILGGRIDELERALNNLGNEVGANYQKLFLMIQGISLTPGPKGDKGDPGIDGKDGINGKDGVDGLNGLPGIPGQDGAKGEKGDKGDSGYTPVKGVDYFDGANGQDGYTPRKGIDYFDGANGQDGLNGLPGAPGQNGSDGYTPVKGVDYFDGKDGAPGIQGVPGINGKDGKDGEDKGMNCVEMQACLAPQTAALAAIKIEQSIQSKAVAALAITAGTTATTVATTAITIAGLLAAFNALVGTIDNIKKVLDLIYGDKKLTIGDIDALLSSKYFPYFAGSFTAIDCDGNNIRTTYQGQGLSGIEQMFGAATAITSALVKSTCTTNTQKYITANICGQTYTTGYQDDGNQAIATILGLAFTRLCTDGVTINPDPLNPKSPFNPGNPYNIVKQIEDKLNPAVSGAFEGTLCNGSIIKAGYGGSGFSGLASALSALNYITNTVAHDACQTYSDTFTGLDCNGNTISVGYSNASISDALKALWIAVLQAVNCGVTPRYTTGVISINTCGVIDSYQYQRLDTPTTQAVESGLRGLATLLGEVFSEICTKIDKLNPATNDPIVSRSLSINACGISNQYSYTTNKSQESYAIANGTIFLMQSVFNEICKKLDFPISGTAKNTLCDSKKTVVQQSFGGNGFSGVISAMSAYSKIQTQAIDVVCTEVQDNMCAVLEPSEEYAERIIRSQLFIRFIDKRVTLNPKDPNYKKIRDAAKFRMVIPNAIDGITCDTLKPLTWIRGNYVSTVIWNNGGIKTYQYFEDKDIAETKMAYAAGLSKDSVAGTGKPRVTSNGSPKRQPANIEIIPYYAVISTIDPVTNQATDRQCLRCLPNT